MEFNTISVSDGVSMGTEGMSASLVSREVIADSVELVARGHLFDGLVCIVGCDKTIPAAAMALARLDLPGLVLYNGSIAPGRYRGARRHDPGRLRGGRRARRGHDDAAPSCTSSRARACPGAGACGGQFTANTMAMALEFLGISPGWAERRSRRSRGKEEAARRGGRAGDASWCADDVRPSQIITREALENAIAASPRRGGSTNGVLHLLAIAREPASRYTIDDFDVIAERTPILAT